MYKKLLPVLVVLLVLMFSSMTLSAAPKDITIYIDETAIESDTPPVILNDRTMVPLRVISENLGAKVFWNGTDRTVTIYQGTLNMIFTIDAPIMLVNGMVVELDSPAVIYENRTMVPLRLIGEMMDMNVRWDGTERAVYIDHKTPSTFLAVTSTQVEDTTLVTLHLDRNSKYEVTTLSDPYRVVLDVMNCMPGQVASTTNIKNSPMTSIRAGQFSTDPLTARLVLDFNSEMPVEVTQDKQAKTITLSFTNDLTAMTFAEETGYLAVDLLKVTADMNPTVAFDYEHNTAELTIPGAKDKLIRNAFVPNVDRITGISARQDGGDTIFTFQLVDGASVRLLQDKDHMELRLGQVISHADWTDDDNLTAVNLHTQNFVKYQVEERSDKHLILRIDDAIYFGDSLMPATKALEAVTFENRDGCLYVSFALTKLINIEVNAVKNCTTIGFLKTEYMGKVIVIDAGHGGIQPGAVVNGIKEKDITLPVALALGDILSRNGAIVHYIRTDDSYSTAASRPIVANELNADLFVSIHCNSHTAATAHGTEVHYIDKDNGLSKDLAACVQAALIEVLGTNNRGIVGNSNLVINRDSLMPSCLVELAFMSNEADLILLTSEGFAEKSANAIAQGIVNYFKNRLL